MHTDAELGRLFHSDKTAWHKALLENSAPVGKSAASPPGTPLTIEILGPLLTGVVDEMIALIQRAASAHAARADGLQARLDAVEARASVSMKWCGTWSESGAYEPADCVTRSGGLWHCEKATRTQPGAGADWRLISKSPRY